MAFGDIKFGNVGVSAHVEGTGTDIFARSSYDPQMVIVTNIDNDCQMFWTQTMAQGSAFKISGSVSPAAFMGNLLPPHDHSLVSVSNNLPVTLYRVYHGAVTGGPFQVGETITGSISTGGGVVTAVGAIYLDFASVTGLVYGETITGGTSGATATTSSSGTGVVTPTNPIFALNGVSGTYDSGEAIPVPVGASINVVQGVVGGNESPGARIHPTFGTVEVCPDTFDGGNLVSIQIDYTTDQTSSVSAGTPTGTIVGGASITYVPTGGITTGTSGFYIGNDPDINIAGNNLYWFALR